LPQTGPVRAPCFFWPNHKMSSSACAMCSAPMPLRSVAGRLTVATSPCNHWLAYLPQRLREQPEFLAASAAAIPAIHDLLPQEDLVKRRADRQASSDCHPSSKAADSELLSWGDDLAVAGKVWELSQDPQGCRHVQRALEHAASEEERRAVAAELHGHVAPAMRCLHGNHVLQKCINTMQPESLQFIVDEISKQEGLVAQTARHRYGCRIIQHLLKVCPASQVSKIAESVLEEADTLACHAFGNYAVQHVVRFGSPEHRYRLTRVIERNITSIAKTVVGGPVIKAIIMHAAPEDRVWVARAAAQNAQAMLALAKSRLGYPCAMLILETISAREMERVSTALAEHLEELRASKFGLEVAQLLAGEC